MYSGISTKTNSKKRPSIPFISAHIIPYLYPQDCQFAILAMQCFPYKDVLTLQVQASASKLQQLPWTAVFAELQLLLLSADAPGLSPYRNACVCTCLDMFQNHPEKTDVKAKAKHILHIFAYHRISKSSHITIPRLLPCNASRTKRNKKCKRASAAALDNCFRKSSTSSAFRCRSWSDSLMLESVHVWIRSGITREKTNKRKSQAYLA